MKERGLLPLALVISLSLSLPAFAHEGSPLAHEAGPIEGELEGEEAESAGSVPFPRPLRQKPVDLPLPRERAFEARYEKTLPRIEGLERDVSQRCIERYSTPASLRWLSETLKRGEPYMAFIRREIEERGLPPELLYLPVIESEYRVGAKSKAGAAGLWQFMTNSIKPYMEITDWVDERYDFWKSTKSALAKLEANYASFGDWALALAAYNCGNGALQTAIKQSGLRDYWSLAAAKKLKADSVYYVPKLLAIYYIASNPRRFGLEPLWHSDVQWAHLSVTSQVDLALLAEYAHLDPQMLKDANRELLYGVTPPGTYALKVPMEDAAAAARALEQNDYPLIRHRVHIIKSGDTLWSLSREYRAPLESILALNSGIDPRLLRPGMRVNIPLVPK